jgi:methyltransferase (TIGR00027 family)
MKPISNTAFYSCGVRMQDAENDKSVCQDVYAKCFMDGRGLSILHNFFDEKKPNAGVLARHRMIDDFIRAELLLNPGLQIILIGAGFDSRAYRLPGGDWIELDEPKIIAYKNKRLPVESCENKLQRIAIDFDKDNLADKLADLATERPVLVVFDGVFSYLQEEAIKQNLLILRNLFPAHKLVCDLMNRAFHKRYLSSLQHKFGELGAGFKFVAKKPSQLFLDSQYQLLEKHSIIAKAIEYSLIRVPKLLFKMLFGTLEQGYALYIFKTSSAERQDMPLAKSVDC